MHWDPPDFVEIAMDAELTAYCEDVAPEPPTEEDDARACESAS
jgi:hypothetical protein